MRNKVEKFPAMQLFTTSFVAETVHISNEKTGMYIKLLCFHWTKHAKPFSTNQAYSICNANDEKTRKLVYQTELKKTRKKSSSGAEKSRKMSHLL